MDTLSVLIVLIIFVLFTGYLISVYNSLIRVKHQLDKAWKNIDLLLKQRTDELEKLIDTVKGHMKYERTLLMELTEARVYSEKARSVEAKITAESKIQNAIKGFYAVAENYPTLSASSSFRHLEERISELEESITDRREFYNNSVFIFNMRIEQIPYIFFASAMGYYRQKYFKIRESEKRDVKIKF
jgi:LemA protein